MNLMGVNGGKCKKRTFARGKKKSEKSIVQGKKSKIIFVQGRKKFIHTWETEIIVQDENSAPPCIGVVYQLFMESVHGLLVMVFDGQLPDELKYKI